MHSILYLTQRLDLQKPISNSKAPSFDDTFRLQYMGSAEFEFGALPASLLRICHHLDEYHSFTANEITQAKTESSLRILCKDNQLSEIIKAILQISEAPHVREPHVKESLYFYENRFAPDKDKYGHVDLWWDIDNDFFFTFGKVTMKKLQVALINTRKKFIEAQRIKV